jgi:diguanylate cyclase (GGDEF)-like protein
MLSAAPTWDEPAPSFPTSNGSDHRSPVLPLGDKLTVLSLVVAVVFAVTLRSERSADMSSALTAAAAWCLALIPWLWALWIEGRGNYIKRWRIIAAAIGILAAAELVSAGYVTRAATTPLWVDVLRIGGAGTALVACILLFRGDENGRYLRQKAAKPTALAFSGALAFVVAIPFAVSQEVTSSLFDWAAAFFLVALPLCAALIALDAARNRAHHLELSAARLSLALTCLSVMMSGQAIDRLTRENIAGSRMSWFALPTMVLLVANAWFVLQSRSATARQSRLRGRDGSTISPIPPRALLRVLVTYLFLTATAALLISQVVSSTGWRSAFLGVAAALVILFLVARQAISHEAHVRAERRLELARIELANRANLDPVTQLPNRRALDERLAEEAERSLRYRQPLGLCFVDLDHFKHVNDRHGHAAGDVTLRQVAATLRRTARAVDFVARFGGEEFVVLLPGTWSEDAATLGERLRRAVAALPIRTTDGQVLHLTISVGVAGLPEHARDAATLNDCADKALYLAKQAGRNRVVLYDPELASQAVGIER